MWLVDKGYYLSGWPRGLPRGSISIWAAHYTFALAAMFINETITLQPLSRSVQSKQQASTAKARADSMPLSSTSASAAIQPVAAPEERYGSGLGSDQDADGSSDREFESESEPQAPVFATAAAIKEPIATYSTSAASFPISDSLHLPGPSSSIDSTPRAERAGSATNLTLPSDSCISSANLLPLETTTLEAVDSARKRKVSDDPVPEMLYPGVPSGATVNWVPPVSAARELKKTRKG